MLETKMIGFDCLKEMYEGDDTFGEIFKNCEKFSKDGFYKYEGYLFKENKLCVPKFLLETCLCVKLVKEG